MTLSRFHLVPITLAVVVFSGVFLGLSSLLKPGAVVSAAEPNIPRGVIGMNPNGKPVLAALWTHPQISGILFGMDWPTLEPSERKFDWTLFDSELPKFSQNGKVAVFIVVSGGETTPQWVHDAGVQTTLSFVDQNPFHVTFGQTITFPAFWDPVFLTKKKAMIQALGAHVAPYQSVISVVRTACVNATTNDWNFGPRTDAEIDATLAAGYTPDKLIDACKQIIDTTAAAFPNAALFFTVGHTPQRLDPARRTDYVARTVVEYAVATYPGRILIGNAALNARTPQPVNGSLPIDASETWQLIHDYKPNTAAQMVWNATDTTTCRMNGRITPCDSVTMLQTAVNTAILYGMRYVEIYRLDLKNSALAGVVQYAAENVGAGDFSLTSPGNQIVNAGETVIIPVTATLTAGAPRSVSFVASGLPTGATASFTPSSCTTTCTTSMTVATRATTPIGSTTITVTGTSGILTRTTSFTLTVNAADITPPTIPTLNPATVVSSSEINLSWSASTDASGIANYELERCTGVSCTTFAQIAIPAGTSYSNNTGLTENTVYRYRVRAKDGAGLFSAYSNIVNATTLPAASLPPITDWKFDENIGTTANDSATADGAQNGTLLGGVTWTPGRRNSALSFNGTKGRYVSIPDSAPLDITGNITLAGWVWYTTAPPTSGASKSPRLMQKGASVGTSVYALKGDSKLDKAAITDPSVSVKIAGTTYTAVSSQSLATGRWYHVAGVRAGRSLKIYIDGVERGSVTIPSGALTTNNDALQISESTGNTDGVLNGKLDELRIYNRSLSLSEIQALANPDTIVSAVAVTAPLKSTGLGGIMPKPQAGLWKRLMGGLKAW